VKNILTVFMLLFILSLSFGITAINAYASADGAADLYFGGTLSAADYEFFTLDIDPRIIDAAKQVKSTFSDVQPSDWYFQYIEELAERGLAYGNDDGTYAPEAPLLVDEFLAFTLRTLGYDIPGAEGYWAQPYIEQALAAGLIEPGEYDSYDVPIIREQIAEIVVRASGKNFSKYKYYKSIFSDLDLSCKSEYILKAIELGVLAGYDDKTFRPLNAATRAEAAIMVLRMIDESYRLEMYGDIFFNRKADLGEHDIMKRGKAEEFLMKTLKSMQIRVSDEGKAILRMSVPELPKGQYLICDVSFFDAKGFYTAFRSTASVSPHDYITWPGDYEDVTEADVAKVGHISVVMGITQCESLYENRREPSVAYVIYKYFNETDYQNGFIVKDKGAQRSTGEYDFELTKGLWGW